jgi:trigger factor
VKIEKQVQDDHQARLVVEVDQELIDTYRRRAARKLAERGKIPGFRPGKAPYDVIVRHFGEPAIAEQAVDLLVEKEYAGILKEAGVDPAGAGSLEAVDSLQPAKFTFRVPLRPEVDLGDYHAVRLPYRWSAPSQKEVDAALDDLRRMYASTETVEREVRPGDYVLVDVTSDLEGLTRSGFATFVRPENREDEWPFTGFAQRLTGSKAGESKTIPHKFAKDHATEALQGKSAELVVLVKTVRSVTLPELDDDFAKTARGGENVEALKEAVKKEVEARSRADYDDTYYVDLIEKLKQRATIRYAPQTLDHETEHVLEDLGRRLGQQGMDLPTYYKVRNTTAERFLEEEARPAAMKRLERSLILEEIVRKEEIGVTKADLDEEFSTTVNDLSLQGMDFGKIRGGRQGQQRVAEALATESANRVLTRRALDLLKAIATGKYKEYKLNASKAAETSAPTEKTEQPVSAESAPKD